MPTKHKPLTAPGAPLPNTLTLPHSPALRRLLSRLSKDSLLELVLSWLDATKVHLYNPSLTSEDDDSDEEEPTLDTIHEEYEGYKNSRGVKGKDIVERVIEREWRSGLNLLQIAELDYRYLLDHPSAHKWTAAILHPLNSSSTSPPTPRFHASAFVHTLQSLLRPMIAAHYFIARHPTLALTLLRLQLHPPSSPLQLPSTKRIFYIVFPTDAPGHLYHDIAVSPDNLRDVVRASIAAAVSRPHARFELRPSNLSARTLEAMVYYRGCGGGEGGMVGAWSVYVDGVEPGPLEIAKRGVDMVDVNVDGRDDKRQRIAEGRFGNVREGDRHGVESVEFRVEDVFPGMPDGVEDVDDEEEFRPSVTVRLDGAHVFAGVRTMVENGVGFDGMRMPGWITGEEAVSVGTVRDGRLLKRRW